MFKVKTKVHPAMIAIWAALMMAANLLPSFPVFGTGGTFSVSYALAPLAGIMFGPYAGALAVAIGEFIGSVIAPHNASLGMFTFLINMTNAFTVGFISRKKWQVPLVVTVLLTIVWFLVPGGIETGMYSVIYFAGMVMCFIGAVVGTRFLAKENILAQMLGVFLIAWPGYIAGSIVGNIFTLLLYEIPAELWYTFLIWMTPFERTVFAIGAAVIGTPLLIALPKIGIYVGPKYDGQEAENELDAQIRAKIDGK